LALDGLDLIADAAEWGVSAIASNASALIAMRIMGVSDPARA
jgi:hypothetical protein